MPTLNRIGATRQPTLADIGGTGFDRYIPLYGPPESSPAGLPVQASEANPFFLTRSRIGQELYNNPATARAFDINTTAEVPLSGRRPYQAATIDRAVQQGRSLGSTISDPNYYPPTTLFARGGAGFAPDPATFEGANFANFGTGNASYDPKTGRWVGFAGGPQTATSGRGRSTELYGIEGPAGLEYARTMGYLGPDRTPIGPSGPAGGGVASGEPLPPAGWQTTVAAAPGYVPPATIPQGATTSAADLAPPSQYEPPPFWQRFLGAIGQQGVRPPARPTPYPTPQLGTAFHYSPVGRRGVSGV